VTAAFATARRRATLRERCVAALPAAAGMGFIGACCGLIAFAIISHFGDPEDATQIWRLGTLFSGLATAAVTFLNRLQWAGPPAVMGSAAWADARSLAAECATPALVRDRAALLVGRSPGRRGKMLRYAGPAHLLTIAPTRSGKGVGTVLPNLLLADRAILCVDPKGENARIAARARQRFGPVFVLDPFGASGHASAAYDPTALLDPRSPDLVDDAATLADALVFDPPGQVAEAHWNGESKALIAGLLMHLACRAPQGHRGLPALRHLLTLPPRE
jgi:type IV secretion system protein VirD4